MPRFAANISLLYADRPFLDRYAAAAADGFSAVECLFPYAWPAEAVAEALATHGLSQVLINAPPGDLDAGERGLGCLPGREAEFAAGVELALAYAATLGCPRIHVMAGIAPAGSDRARLRAVYVANLRHAASLAETTGIDLLIEPINTGDVRGYFLNRQDEAHAIVEEIGSARLKVQMDLYHCRLVEGDVAAMLRATLPTGRVGHLQIAGAPGRHEPDTGQLAYEPLFDLIDGLGYDGWIGCEYRPAGDTSAGLGWLRGRQRPSDAARP